MKIKTSELTGAAFDWAVAKCEGAQVDLPEWDNTFIDAYDYSTNWSQGGPIIEREDISLIWSIDHWHSYKLFNYNNSFNGRDNDYPLVAAMRCYVASELGDIVDVPEELA